MKRSSMLLLASVFGLTVACGGDDTSGNSQSNNKNTTMTGMDMAAVDMSQTKEDMKVEVDMFMPKEDMKVEVDMKMEEDMKMEVDMAPAPGEEVEVEGFFALPPYPTSCDMPGGKYRFPFTIFAKPATSNRRRGVRPGDLISGRAIVPNDTVNIGLVTTERPRISPEKITNCVTRADCDPGYLCSSAGLLTSDRVCVKQTSVEFVPDSLRFDYEAKKQQLVTVLVDNGSMREGIFPVEIGGPKDENGDRDICAIQREQFCVDRSTDPEGKTKEFVDQFLLNLASYADPANTRVSVSVAAGDKAVLVSPITGEARPEDHYTTDLRGARAALNKLPEPNRGNGNSNIYQGIMRVIQTDMGLEKYKDFEKFLLVITDGPNDVWDKDATAQKVLEALEANNIKLFVLHYDTSIATDTLRDPLAYWAGNDVCRRDNNKNCPTAKECLRDDSCLNFEECRTVKIYGEPVTQTTKKYCVPKYRDDGRLGPINVYADMACRTGGNYFYFSDFNASEQLLKNLPAAFDGQWSAEAEVSSLAIDRIGTGFFRFSGAVLGLLGNRGLSTIFSAETFEPNDQNELRRIQRENRPVVPVGVVDRGAKDR